jgi:transcriptional regulator with XRE-family HTH domain
MLSVSLFSLRMKSAKTASLYRAFGALVRRQRKRKRLTTSECARRSGLAASVFGKLENGQLIIMLGCMMRLSETLQISPREMLESLLVVERDFAETNEVLDA